jgi:hypothetical protein
LTAPSWDEGRPPKLDAVRRDDALLDELSARRAGSPYRKDAGDDVVALLLGALVEDVNCEPIDDTVPRPVPARGTKGQRRRLPRTVVALGVTTVVLASTGVAAAGGLNPFSSGPGPRELIAHPHMVSDGTVEHPSRPPKHRHQGSAQAVGAPTGHTKSTTAAPQNSQGTRPEIGSPVPATPSTAPSATPQGSPSPSVKPSSPSTTPTAPSRDPHVGGSSASGSPSVRTPYVTGPAGACSMAVPSARRRLAPFTPAPGG